MKFLKSQNTSRYSPSDNTFQVNPYGRAVMDFNGAVMLPKGTEAQRPDITGVRQPTDANGYIRYNTDTDSIEAYVDGVWEVVRAPGASTITKQTLGPGDDTETVFGPLLTDAIYLNAYSASADNLLVLVENVVQISTTNFTVEQSSSGNLTGPSSPYADGWYLKFTSPVPTSKNVTIYYGFAN